MPSELGFSLASELPISEPRSYTEDLEQRVRDQEILLGQQAETIHELQERLVGREVEKRERPKSDDLKGDERLMLLARINDLTIANNEKEIEILELLKKHDAAIELLNGFWRRMDKFVDDYDEKLARLEPRTSLKTGEPNQKTQDHLTAIWTLLCGLEKVAKNSPKPKLIRFRQEGVSLTRVAEALHLTPRRARQLAELAAKDERFNVIWHPKKKNSKIIKLRRWDNEI